MRLLLGMILGAALTIGVAYVHDSTLSSPPGTASVESRPMVNWDVVNNSWSHWKTRAQHGWIKLTEYTPSIPKNLR
jgi:hypothetical protein